jgi:hypothetical protein
VLDFFVIIFEAPLLILKNTVRSLFGSVLSQAAAAAAAAHHTQPQSQLSSTQRPNILVLGKYI